MKLTFFLFWCSRLLLVGLLLKPPAARAQYTVQVVSKSVEQTLSCPPGTLVRIRGEKATIRILSWDQPTARLVLKLSARHPQREVAEGELPSARYQFTRHGNTLDLVNYYTVAAGITALRSDLRAEYTLWVPAGVRLELRNLYGQTTLVGLTGVQEVEQDFGQVTLTNLRGSLRATVRYADVVGTNTEGTLVCQAEKSSVRLTGVAGRCTVTNSYGSVVLAPAPGLVSAAIDATRTDVTLHVVQPDLFNYQLTSAHGTLAVPPWLASGQRSTASQAALQLMRGPALPLLHVATSYASITLQTTQFTILR